MKSNVVAVLALVMVVLFGAASAQAGGTAPGVDITNKATATYTVGTASVTKDSNTTHLIVAELINVNVTWQDAGSVLVAPGAEDGLLTFRVTNTGNGTETFPLSLNMALLGDNFDPLLCSPSSVYLDTNNNGVYDAGVDSAYVAGTNDPTLAADAYKTVFILGDIPATVVDTDTGKSALTASAATVTGSSVAGTLYAGAGDSGSDAIVGTSTASDTDTGTYLVSNVTVSVAKSQTVSDPFGGTSAVPGATIQYTLLVTVTGTGTAVGVTLTDPIPANTTYTAGTLTLNTLALSDAKDGDSGDVGGTTTGYVTVSLGSLTSTSATQTIVFKVTIN